MLGRASRFLWAVPPARAIRPDNYRDPASLLPAHFGPPTGGFYPYCFASAATTPIV